MLVIRLLSITFLCIGALSDLAYADERDIPQVGRYPGSSISQHEHTTYDEGRYPLGLNSRAAPNEFENELVAGERTTNVYELPVDSSATRLGVIASFQSGLEQQGFIIDLACRSDCGYFFPRALYGEEARTRFRDFREFTNLNGETLSIIAARKDLQRVIVVVGKSRYAQALQYAVDAYMIDELEVSTLDLTETGLQNAMREDGSATLDGIYFETGSAKLSDASRESLETIAAYLRSNPTSSHLIVGHTDTQGDYDSNLRLSQQRALSVKQALDNEFGVDANVLRAIGVGYAAPKASNLTDAGRAQNRRVELVLERASAN